MIQIDIEKPETCCECAFLSKIEELYVDNGLYKKIALCSLHPDEDGDYYRDFRWFSGNIEKYCPIKEVPNND